MRKEPGLIRGRAARRFAALIGTLVVLGAGALFGSSYAAWAEDGVPDPSASVPSTSTGEATTTTADTTTEESTPTETAPAPPPATTSAPEAPEPPPPPPRTKPAPRTAAPAHPAPVQPFTRVRPTPEVDEGDHAIVWLHHALADPTPPAKRLSPAFARKLKRISVAEGLRWPLVLAVVRARGGHGPAPARERALERLAHRLGALRAASHPRQAVASLRQADADFADRVLALARYNRAVGLGALVRGLEWAKPRLDRRILADLRITTSAGARADLASGRIDVRVDVLIRYLAITFRQVTVSSLHSGHPYYASPGVVSAHMYGLAVDVSALGGVPISGHQQPGGLVEHAVEQILLLPAELQPQQVISLVGLGGPSFPLADHYDHIHIGF
jgi:hypothetical protein